MQLASVAGELQGAPAAEKQAREALWRDFRDYEHRKHGLDAQLGTLGQQQVEATQKLRTSDASVQKAV